MSRILRFPTALVAAIERSILRLLRTAVLAELALVHSSAGAGPAVVSRFRRTALGAELSGRRSTAFALPRACLNRLGFLRAALGAELSGNGSAALLFLS